MATQAKVVVVEGLCWMCRGELEEMRKGDVVLIRQEVAMKEQEGNNHDIAAVVDEEQLPYPETGHAAL